jgi:Aerotolerance regulator N-terminal/von Willebrand factor type A domain
MMSFLAPLFLVGLTALAIPVLIHLIQRERKTIVAFPSLMFLRRIPYQSVRRRKVRHWLLLAMRAAAVMLIVAAFARPFLRQGAMASAVAGGAREVVILLDQSASMGYGDHWQRAREAARQAIDRLGPDDRATLVLFASNAEENVRASADRVRLKAAVDAARVTSGATRYGPALKLAQSILIRSPLKRREAILVSDFQKTGWAGQGGVADVHFPEGTVLTPASVASPDASNIAVPSVTFARASFSGQERLTITAGVTNRSAAAIANLPVTLDIDGRTIESRPVSVAPHASASVTFTQFTLADPNVKGIVRAGTDLLPQDNVFRFVLTPGRPIAVLVIDQRSDRSEPSLYLSKALGVGTAPAFKADLAPASHATAAELDTHAVVVLNDVPFPQALANGALARFLERGGGLLVVLGEHSTWPASEAALLPGALGALVDPPGGRSGSLGFLDYSHPIFEVFKAPRSGDFSGAHIFRYRALDASAPGTNARVLARFDDGGVAAAERRIGAGRAIVWTSTLDDSWNDLALKPVFLPLMHQIVGYLARYEEPAAWRTVGQALDVSGRAAGRGGPIVLTPSGQRIALGGSLAPRFVELGEQGFYEIRATPARADAQQKQRPEVIVAVNLDPAESDLTSMDPRELVAAAIGHAAPDAGQRAAPLVAPEDAERRQAIWWYLLLAGGLLLAAETILSNRLSRTTTTV